MSLFRTQGFFWLYRFLPHRLLNLLASKLMRAEVPAFAIQALIRRWIRTQGIPMADFETAEYRSLEDFFLRRLREGARPQGEGITSPADGLLLQRGRIEDTSLLQVKGQRLSVGPILGRPEDREEAEALEGGGYATIFLTPHGYHYLHAPCPLTVEEIRWRPGRFFPQNEDAIHTIPRIYERNERAILSCRDPKGGKFYLVLVGASLIGSIELAAFPQASWMRQAPLRTTWRLDKGQEIGHFRFGSTILLLGEAGLGWQAPPLPDTPNPPPIRLGETLFSLKVRDDP